MVGGDQNRALATLWVNLIYVTSERKDRKYNEIEEI